MPDGAVFSGCVHGLKNQQHGVAIGRVEKLLLRAQFRDVISEELLILFLRFVYRIDERRPLFEIDPVSFPHPEFLVIHLHLHPFLRCRLHTPV